MKPFAHPAETPLIREMERVFLLKPLASEEVVDHQQKKTPVLIRNEELERMRQHPLASEKESSQSAGATLCVLCQTSDGSLLVKVLACGAN